MLRGGADRRCIDVLKRVGLWLAFGSKRSALTSKAKGGAKAAGDSGNGIEMVGREGRTPAGEHMREVDPAVTSASTMSSIRARQPKPARRAQHRRHATSSSS